MASNAARNAATSAVKGSGAALMSVDFEVFGKVQGVFFRKYTQKNAKKFGLVGWVQNTPKGTVLGQMQGRADKIRSMKVWLEREGSPMSRIDRAEYRNERGITAVDFSAFQVKYDW
ncbi:acylphosphatase-1-like isoform X1 [Ptychodera flava]|uniref:acylphosphatase-1-like isoform X1 n=1 Tax=Ptychodera flava TaxID=63121 RepID=UPI00396A3CDD